MTNRPRNLCAAGAVCAAVAALCLIPELAAAFCGDAIVEAGERCDDGGICIGGRRAGSACNSENECVDGGACFGGLDDLRACNTHEDCRHGRCRRCRPVGGDGCAANCTIETFKHVDLVEGTLVSGVDIALGTSGATLFGRYLTVPLPMTGAIALTVGETADGVLPFVIKQTDVRIPRIALGSLTCACVRGISHATCGGTLVDADGASSPDCTPGSFEAVECPEHRPCAAIYGNGNAAAGFIACGGRGVDIEVSQDCNGTSGAPPLPVMMTLTEEDEAAPPNEGNALAGLSTAIGLAVGECSGSGQDLGPDGEFCTDDDPPASRGAIRSVLLTSGSTSGVILNPGDSPGDVSGAYGTGDGRGTPFRCDGGTVDLESGAIGGVFTECDRQSLGDTVVPISFAFTAPRSPTPSATATRPTPTPTRTPTRTRTPTPLVVVRAQDVLDFGCELPVGVRFPVEFSLEGEGVAGIQNDIVFDNTVLGIDVESCRINPAAGLFPLGPEPATSCLEDNTIGPCKSLAMLTRVCGATPRPDGCPAGAGSNISVIRALIAGTASLNNTAIPEGVLYRCEVEIIGFSAGTILDISHVIASDGAGRRIPTRGDHGIIGGECPPPSPTLEPRPTATPTLNLTPTVDAGEPPTPSPSSTAKSRIADDGCSMGDPGRRSGNNWVLIAGLALLAWRSRLHPREARRSHPPAEQS